MDKEDLKVTTENNKLLSLTESPIWGTFVKMVEHDMEALDSLSNLYIDKKDREELVREVEVRYHTIAAIREYIAVTIERAQTAQEETEEDKSDVINVVES